MHVHAGCTCTDCWLIASEALWANGEMCNSPFSQSRKNTGKERNNYLCISSCGFLETCKAVLKERTLHVLKGILISQHKKYISGSSRYSTRFRFCFSISCMFPNNIIIGDVEKLSHVFLSLTTTDKLDVKCTETMKCALFIIKAVL